MHRTATAMSSDRRRARTLAGSLLALLASAAIYANNAHAAPCGSQSDFLIGDDRLGTSVRPADCSSVFQGPPDFTWASARGASEYTVALTFPDGSTQERTTRGNWLAWDAELPAGRYTWQVLAAGARSAPRTFTVERPALAFNTSTHADAAHAASARD